MLEGVKYKDLARFSYSQQAPDELLACNQTLAVITFDGAAAAVADPRLVATGLRQLGDARDKCCELWTTASPVTHVKESWGGWASSNEYMFCSVDLGAFFDADKDLELASYRAYTTILTHSLAHGFPHILRAWNYFPSINHGEGDNERYKQFCSGRYRAYADVDRGADEKSLYPAACAIGSHRGAGCVYILAGKYAAKNYENPFQQSAFKYPRQYGPHSPSFARASVVESSAQDLVFVSGTASIRGNETITPYELEPQLHLSFENIDYLLKHIQAEMSLSGRLELDVVKVYLRNPERYEWVRRSVEQYIPKRRVLFLEGDICRADLEIEIDGLCYSSGG